MQVSKCIEFDAAHRVPYHESKCKHIHGHRYKVVATIDGTVIPDTELRPDAGMVVDFGVIKDVLMELIHDVFDHRTIVWIEDKTLRDALLDYDFGNSLRCVPCIPTAENLAEYFASLIIGPLSPLTLCSLAVYETPTSVATWTP